MSNTLFARGRILSSCASRDITRWLVAARDHHLVWTPPLGMQLLIESADGRAACGTLDCPTLVGTLPREGGAGLRGGGVGSRAGRRKGSVAEAIAGGALDCPALSPLPSGISGDFALASAHWVLGVDRRLSGFRPASLSESKVPALAAPGAPQCRE